MQVRVFQKRSLWRPWKAEVAAGLSTRRPPGSLAGHLCHGIRCSEKQIRFPLCLWISPHVPVIFASFPCSAPIHLKLFFAAALLADLQGLQATTRFRDGSVGNQSKSFIPCHSEGVSYLNTSPPHFFSSRICLRPTDKLCIVWNTTRSKLKTSPILLVLPRFDHCR